MILYDSDYIAQLYKYNDEKMCRARMFWVYHSKTGFNFNRDNRLRAFQRLTGER